MDKKIPDTVIGILEHSGEYVKIDENGRFTVDGIDVNGKNILDVMNTKKGIMPTMPLYEPMPIMGIDYASKEPNYKQDLNDLKDFLTFKGIEIDKDELKDFIEARKLAEKMTMDPNTVSFPANFKFIERYGIGVINPKGIAKVTI